MTKAGHDEARVTAEGEGCKPNRRVSPGEARWECAPSSGFSSGVPVETSALLDSGGMREGAGKVALLASPLSWSTNRTEFLS
jgi:hypothetical protein